MLYYCWCIDGQPIRRQLNYDFKKIYTSVIHFNNGIWHECNYEWCSYNC